MNIASNASYAFSSWSTGAWILLALLIAAALAAVKGKGKFRFAAIIIIAGVILAGYALNAHHM